jgi:hypothetical protein
MNFHFEPRLMEDAVGASLARQPMLAARYRADVEVLYDDVPLDEREPAFARLHATWFESLELDRPLRAIFKEFPVIVAAALEVVVAQADRRRDEGAVLAPRTMRLGLRLTPARFTNSDALSCLMRHELTHVGDMLDPEFGYPDRPPNGATAGENLIRDRYRLLWDLSVDGRLARAKKKSIADAAMRRRELDALYFSLSEATRLAIFDRLWGATGLTHDRLWAMASDVRALVVFAGVSGVAGAPSGPLPGARCPLCGFPTYVWSPPLESRVVSIVQSDFPTWHPEVGMCDRCAEHYRIRAGDWRLDIGDWRSGVGDLSNPVAV